MNNQKIILHVDVNSAFLSWSAVDRLHRGEEIDIRNIPAVIGHDESRGVVLAKSETAKKFKIVTGESVITAKRKCPDIVIINPDFNAYSHYSKLMVELLKQYTPYVEQYSIDECFLDVTNFLEDDPVVIANSIRKRIHHFGRGRRSGCLEYRFRVWIMKVPSSYRCSVIKARIIKIKLLIRLLMNLEESMGKERSLDLFS